MPFYFYSGAQPATSRVPEPGTGHWVSIGACCRRQDFKRVNILTNYQQVMGRVVQDALTQQDNDRCMGVPYILVRPSLGLQIEIRFAIFVFRPLTKNKNNWNKFCIFLSCSIILTESPLENLMNSIRILDPFSK